MQKFFKDSITKKILIVLVIAILCNFIIPNYCQAEDIGGVLFDPIRWLLSALADATISVVNMGFTGTWIFAGAAKAKGTASNWKERWAENAFSGEIDWPTILVSPEEIFADKVLALKVNFLKDVDSQSTQDIAGDTYVTIDNSVRDIVYGGTDTKNAISELRKQIAKWYLLIRNLSAAALFCVLIYIGIRMIISSVSEERAKYKSMMIDWVAAICLVFFLHYIMATIMYVTEKAVEIVGSGTSNGYTITQPGTTTPEEFEITGSAVSGAHLFDENVSGTKTSKVYNLLEYARVYVNSESGGLAMRIFNNLYCIDCIYNNICC